MEKAPEGALPGAASPAWLLGPALGETEHLGLEERPGANSSLGSSLLGQEGERSRRAGLNYPWWLLKLETDQLMRGHLNSHGCLSFVFYTDAKMRIC